MNPGFVYVLTNPAMPGLVKIGLTTRNVKQRIDELYTTGVPHRFTCVYNRYVTDCSVLELALHRYFKRSRVNNDREFFKISPQLAQHVMDKMIGVRK